MRGMYLGFVDDDQMARMPLCQNVPDDEYWLKTRGIPLAP